MDVLMFSEKLGKMLEEEGTFPDPEAKDRILSLHTQLLPFSSFVRCILKWVYVDRPADTVMKKIVKLVFDVEDALDMYMLNSVPENFHSLCRFQDSITQLRSIILRMYPGASNLFISDSQIQPPNLGTRRRLRNPAEDVLEARFVGRDEELNVLLDRLMEGETGLSVVTVFGMSGLGKTTLASQVYHNAYVKNHFECLAWISVPYFTKRTFEVLLKSLVPEPVASKVIDTNNEEEMKKSIYQFLSTTRFLVVLDDILYPLWSAIKCVFPDVDGSGSRVMLTTYHKQFAHPRNNPLHLRRFSTQESLEMLLNCCPCPCPLELMPIARSLAEESDGWPLFNIFMGGLLSEKETSLPVWTNLENLYKEVKELDKSVMFFAPAVVRFAYSQLPLYLRSCLLYFSVFGEDLEISCRNLYQIWIAEGFIPREKNPEAVAESYLQELSDRGFIRVLKRRSDGTIKTLSIGFYPFYHAIGLATTERFVETIQVDDDISHRRMAIDMVSGCNLSDYSYTQITPFLRSFLCLDSDENHLVSKDAADSICRRFLLLRVLDLGDISDTERFPRKIEYLSLLRYLRLNAGLITSIPPSVCKLQNLYTLDMPSSHIEDTPQDIWKMQKLRHLNFGSIVLPRPNPDLHQTYSLRDLTFLSSLCPRSCSRDVLSRIPNIRTLKICGDLSYYHSELSTNLHELCCLESLKLVMRISAISPSSSMVLNEFRFPPSLTHLSLSNTQLKHDPMPTLEILPKLQVLKLKKDSYRGRKLVCSPGGFPCLQVLHLKSMQWLEEWTLGAGAMAKLVCLVINPCTYLKRLPEELWRVKSLKKLELWWPRPELKPRLQEMEHMDRYGIKIYPY